MKWETTVERDALGRELTPEECAAVTQIGLLPEPALSEMWVRAERFAPAGSLWTTDGSGYTHGATVVCLERRFNTSEHIQPAAYPIWRLSVSGGRGFFANLMVNHWKRVDAELVS